MSEHLDADERARLCDLFLELGPDAPTLCEGWTTADLAAHLVVRERDPRSGPGIVLGGKLEEYTNKLLAKEKARGYEAVVERVRSGPPAVPWRIPGLRDLLNLQEYVVHHEDVRRPNGRGPRTDVPEVQEAVWRNLKRGARMQVRKVKDAGIEMEWPGHDTVTVRKGSPTVRVSGDPIEILLRLMGRTDAAQVDVSGDPAAVAAFEQTKLGI
jgi:uncharacterized protein (TIGR03085 family)